MLRILPSIVTCGNLLSGFAALILVERGLLLQAAVCITLAAILDLLDGTIARRCSATGDFGCNLDSLADVISFGAAPAFALYVGVLRDVPPLGIVACAAFLLCGALRLARFPLVKRQDHYLGLPIPPAGLLVVLLAAAGAPPLLALSITLALCALMISEIPFPSPSSFSRRRDDYQHTQDGVESPDTSEGG